MADKRKVSKSIRNLQMVKTWQLVILLILMMFVSATFLRMNNVDMVKRRNAVTDADKSGDTQEITSRIYDLQRYSAAHMNASTGVFYLQEQYNRDARKALDATSDMDESSRKAHAQAEAVCHPQFSGYSRAYLECFVNELNKFPEINKLPDAKMPVPALYRYSFVSPLWSPDFAGWSIVVCALIILVIIARLISLALLRLMLRHHFKEV